MVTLYKANYTTKVYYFRGLEADEKPSKWQGCNVGPNSIYLAMDATPTPKAYCYNGSEWSQVALSTDILNRYYTAQQVDELIAIAQLEGAGVDTSNFVMQSELEPVVAEQHAYTDAVETAHDEFENSLKKDYEDVEHDTVAERLKEDMGALYNRMNEADLVPYESANGQINAGNTYKGITRDTVIKGKTWQNLANFTNFICDARYDNATNDRVNNVKLSYNLKVGTTYTILANVKFIQDGTKRQVSIYAKDNDNNEIYSQPSLLDNGLNIHVIKPQVNFKSLYMYTENRSECIAEVSNVILLEGDYTNVPISELPTSVNGIESVNSPITVKSINKNLFNPNNVVKGVELNADTGGTEPNADWFVTEYIKVKPNTSYYLTKGGDSGYSNSCYDINKNYLGRIEQLNGLLNLPAGVEYLRFNSTLSLLDSEIQFEESTTATTYEPYKEHSVTYELVEPLRSLPRYDENDRITADSVIRDTLHYTFTGEEPRMHIEPIGDITRFRVEIDGLTTKAVYTNMYCNDHKIGDVKEYGYAFTHLGAVYFYDNFTTLSEFKQSLRDKFNSGIPTVIIAERETPIITPIDTQELPTYDGTSNIIVETENIKPVISTKVPSNVPAVLATAMAENKALRAQLATTNTSVEEVQNGSTSNEENVEMLTECVIEMADILYS